MPKPTVTPIARTPVDSSSGGFSIALKAVSVSSSTCLDATRFDVHCLAHLGSAIADGRVEPDFDRLVPVADPGDAQL
jgi:hypothetical protein